MNKEPGHFRLSLQEETAVWFLEEGTLNLFAIQVKNGLPEGPRTLIATISAPCCLFGMTQREHLYELIAITETPSLVRKISLEEVDPSWVEHWINHLFSFFREMRIETERAVLAPAEIELHQAQTLSLAHAIHPPDKQKIQWIEIQKGSVEFLGKPSLPLQGLFPLPYNSWVKAREPSQIKTLAIPAEWPQGLFRFHQIFFGYFHLKKEREQKEESLFLNRKRKQEAETIHASLQEMVDVINPVDPIDTYRGNEPIFKACQIIWSHQNIAVHLAKEALPHKTCTRKRESLFSFVAAIASAAKIRYRTVRLTKNFHLKDCGPILAFLGSELHPIALIDTTPGTYEMVDPRTNKRREVDEPSLKALFPIGFCFYPSFPDALKTGKELLQFTFAHRAKQCVHIIFYSVLGALISLFPSFAIELLFNRIIHEANFSLLWQVTLGLFLAGVSASLFLFLRSLCIVRIEGHSSNQLQLGLWDRLLKLPVHFFRLYSTGDLMMHAMSLEEIRFLLSGTISRIGFAGVFSFFYLIAMLFYSPALTALGISILLIHLMLTLACARIAARMAKNSLDLQGKINGFLIQIITAVGKLRTAGAEKNAFSRWAFLFAKNKKWELRAQSIQNLMTTANALLPFFSYFFLFSWIVLWGRHLSVAAFLAFHYAFMSLYLAMTDLSNALLQTASILPLWKRSKVILEEPLEVFEKKANPGILTGEILLDEIFFRYEEGGPFVLDNISLQVKPKEFIGLVGPSGSGKSTLMRLLIGFETPTAGAIYYDNKDLSSLTIQDVRKQLGIVLQDGGIVSGTIRDNLVCGGIYSPEQINRALNLSGFDRDLENFPMGLHTFLAMGGTTLSGGQKQRLIIARALLPNPNILLFDEATSFLDNRNQKLLTDRIDQLDVTRIVIAHRLTTLQNADRIYVLDQGKIVQTGTFPELSKTSGLFARILERQRL